MNILAKNITKIIDFFYKPFEKWVPEQVFRYGMCGGGNMVLDWVLYFLFYNFVVGHDNVTFHFSVFNFSFTQVITPHILTLCIVFPITLFTGFWLNRNVTFTQSSLHGARQLGRYILIVTVNLAIIYFSLKLCVEVWGWYPTPSKMLITMVTVVISFFAQKYFSFRT